MAAAEAAGAGLDEGQVAQEKYPSGEKRSPYALILQLRCLAIAAGARGKRRNVAGDAQTEVGVDRLQLLTTKLHRR